MSAANPARVTVQEDADHRFRDAAKAWRVLLDDVEGDYWIIQPKGDWAEGGYQVTTLTMTLLGVRTFDGALARVAGLLGAL